VTSDAHDLKCVAYLPSMDSRIPLLTGPNLSLSQRNSAIAAPTGRDATSDSAPFLSTSALPSLALVSLSCVRRCLDRRFFFQIPARSHFSAMTGSSFSLLMARFTTTSNCEAFVIRTINSRRILIARLSYPLCVQHAPLRPVINVY